MVEQDGVLAHEVVDRGGFAAEGQDVLADRVEAEEGFVAVNDVELEQRGGVVHADLGNGAFDQAEGAQFGDCVGDGANVAVHDRGRSGAELGAVGEVVNAARDGQRGCGVRDEDAHGDGLGAEAAGSDLVERLLHRAVQGLAGEAGEVDRNVLGLEGAFDVRAQADRAFGALADEDPAPLAGHDQAFFAQLAQRVLHRHGGDVVGLGQLVARWELVTGGELLREDRRS